MNTTPSSPFKVTPGTPIPSRKDASWISQNSSPIKREYVPQTPPREKKKSCVCSMGRIFSTLYEIPKALFNLVLKIFDLAIQFFRSLINRCFSREYQYPTCAPFIKGDEAILDFIEQKRYESNEDPQILDGLLRWVVNHPEEIEAEDLDALQKWALSHPLGSNQHRKENLEKMSHLKSEQDNVESLTDKHAYCRNLDRMDDKQLANFVQTLDIKGRHSPLHHLFKKELENIGVISATNFDEVGKRFKVILRSLSREQTNALAYYNKFWALIYKYPVEAAQNLDAEQLAILATNRNKHRVELSMIIGRLAEDDQLHLKLDAIAPHATTAIELILKGKVERLVNINFAINGKDATIQQKQDLKDSLNQKIDAKLAHDRSLLTRILQLLPSIW